MARDPFEKQLEDARSARAPEDTGDSKPAGEESSKTSAPVEKPPAPDVDDGGDCTRCGAAIDTELTLCAECLVESGMRSRLVSIAHRNLALGMLLGFLFPPAGYLYMREPRWAVACFMTGLFLFVGPLISTDCRQKPNRGFGQRASSRKPMAESVRRPAGRLVQASLLFDI